jgi:hypothetical protein
MHSPFWVASARVDVQKCAAFGNHTLAFGVKEGRIRPGHALPCDPAHRHPLTRPESAKSASSQGGALALDRRNQTQNQTHLNDMKMELYS